MWKLYLLLIALCVACESAGEGGVKDGGDAGSDAEVDDEGTNNDEANNGETGADMETPCRCLQPSECVCVVIGPSGLEPVDVSLKGGQSVAWFNDTSEPVEVFIGEDADPTTAVGKFLASESISFFPFERTRYDVRAETFTHVGSLEVTR